jgi:hypothetical protein
MTQSALEFEAFEIAQIRWAKFSEIFRGGNG